MCLTESRTAPRRAARFVLAMLLGPLLCGAVGWASLALWFDGPASRPLAGALVGGLVLAVLALLAFLRGAGSWRSAASGS